MSNFLRDLAIAKFPRFGIVYYIQLDASIEPDIQGASCRVPLKFYDGKQTPPQHLSDKTVKLPMWKWGEYMDIVEAEMFADTQHIVAVELVKRRPDDEYGHLAIQMDKQVTLDASLRDAPRGREGDGSLLAPAPTPTGPSKPAAAVNADKSGASPPVPSSERGQPGAGDNTDKYGNPPPFVMPPATPCVHPPLERTVAFDGSEVLVYDCGVCAQRVTELKDVHV